MKTSVQPVYLAPHTHSYESINSKGFGLIRRIHLHDTKRSWVVMDKDQVFDMITSANLLDSLTRLFCTVNVKFNGCNLRTDEV